MDKDELWLSFIKSGSVKDYLSYIESKKDVKKSDADNNGRPRDKGEQYRG